LEKSNLNFSPSKKALFLDRDGIINEDTEYPHKPEHITFKKGIFEFCKKAIDKGFILVVVSNQAGVAKGYYTEDDVVLLHKWMEDKFREQGISIAKFYYCPYHIEGTVEKYRKDSPLRKPRPGMILQASKDLGIDLEQSVMIGDKPSDRIELEELKSIIVYSKYSLNDYDAENIEALEEMI
jgi:D,D-heptose 1,7-bisphosphate phosphatase